jgi:hypothetical protein
MQESSEIRQTMLDFYRSITVSDVERFDDLVSADPSTLVIGTAIGEWVSEPERLRYGFEAEGLSVDAGPNPVGHEEGSVGWFVDEPRYRFSGGGMRTRLTAVLHREAGLWKIVHLHVSVGVPDEEVVPLQERWGVT